MENFKIITFKNNNLQLDVNVSPNEETVWLSKDQIALLFDRDRTVISRHINKIYKEGELDEKSTCAKNAQVQIEGGREVTRKYEFYNLDVIISVGYRVKSKNGIIFRKWAINVLKEYLIKGYSISDKSVVSKQKIKVLDFDPVIPGLEEFEVNALIGKSVDYSVYVDESGIKTMNYGNLPFTSELIINYIDVSGSDI